jgi:hypothetical protein
MRALDVSGERHYLLGRGTRERFTAIMGTRLGKFMVLKLLALLGGAAAVGVLAVVCIAGCGGNRDSASRVTQAPLLAELPQRPEAVSFRRDVEPVLMGGCSGEFCHGNNVNTPRRAYGFLLNQSSTQCADGRLLVVPFDPNRSYVLDKIKSRNLCAGESMPRGMWNRLPPDQVATIETWIAEGARYN